jgi:hypothetical protein
MSAVTAFGLVAQAVEAALVAAPALAGGNVKANPTRPWEREVAACIALRLVNAQRVEGFNCGETWALTLAADCEARRTANTDPADAADALLNAVADRLAVLDLSALGVIERTTDDAIEWQFDATEHASAMVSLRFGYHVNVTDTYTVPTP